jgi:hypothetical protein
LAQIHFIGKQQTNNIEQKVIIRAIKQGLYYKTFCGRKKFYSTGPWAQCNKNYGRTLLMFLISWRAIPGRYDTQHNDIQHDDVQHNK